MKKSNLGSNEESRVKALIGSSSTPATSCHLEFNSEGLQKALRYRYASPCILGRQKKIMWQKV